jgi:multidrug efflux pump subunit AcrB
MTSLAAILGMLPLALALGSGSELLQPLAIAVIGGLMFALVLSLIVTPVVYSLMHRRTAVEPG